MRLHVQLASIVAMTATMMTAALSISGSRAAAQDLVPTLVQTESATSSASALVPAIATAAPDQAAIHSDDEAEAPATLADLVDAQPQPDTLSREMKCLAGAIYFEAKGETLAGQLAVGRVVINRSKSGRFPASYCGVVYQHSQFSFIHGNAMPVINTGSRSWQRAVAIAQIAESGAWKSRSEGALFFHAARVSPAWHMTRVAQVDDHVFYR